MANINNQIYVPKIKDFYIGIVEITYKCQLLDVIKTICKGDSKKTSVVNSMCTLALLRNIPQQDVNGLRWK